MRILGRWLVDEKLVNPVVGECIPTGQLKLIGKWTRCSIWTIRGIPGRLAKLQVDNSLVSGEGDGPVCLEEVVRERPYDADPQFIITLRRWIGSELPRGGLELLRGSEFVSLYYGDKFRNIRSFPIRDVKDDEVEKIWFSQWTAWYRFLPREEVVSEFEVFKTELSGYRDIVYVTRGASQSLYGLARRLGWRKLTLEEQRRHGVSGSWQLATTLVRTNRGVGDYTLRSANPM